MLTVAAALKLVLDHCQPLPVLQVPTAEALGLVLAEEVQSDIDSPPHDRAIVDGYAVQAADLASGHAQLEVLEEVTAGALPTRSVARSQATRVMTGAPIPTGADAMVMVERTRLDPTGRIVQIAVEKVAVGQNIMRRATSMRRGQTVLAAGASIRPIEIGLLAEVGRTHISVVPRPTVAILATGNELVPADKMPAAGQIRNSNGPLLIACAQRAGGVPRDLGIGRDDRDELLRLLGEGLKCDVLVISGGVSAGVLDLVPGVLAELGVEQIFHKVQLKPGKPLWFGVQRHDSRQTLVFGLPGNPVSSLVCFELFARPALGRLAGRGDAGLQRLTARLTAPYTHRGDRPTYHPARHSFVDGGWHVEPLAWRGSGDLCTLSNATALASFPAGDRQYAAGESIEIAVI